MNRALSFLAAFLVVGNVAASALPPTLEAHTRDRSMTVVVTPLPGDDVAYDVRITDLRAQTFVDLKKVISHGREQVAVTSTPLDVGGAPSLYRVHITPKPYGLDATLEVERGDRIIETMTAFRGSAPDWPAFHHVDRTTAASPVAAGALVSAESRSTMHSLSVAAQRVAGDMIEYHVLVTDLASGQTIADLHARAHDGESAEACSGEDVCVRMQTNGANLQANLVVSRNGAVVDSLTTFWNETPRPRHVSALVDGRAVYRVGGEVRTPSLIERHDPIYSPDARAARVSGIVIVETLIDKDGVVREAFVLKGLPFGLDQAAVDAIRRWRFLPATKDGQPVDAVFNVTVNFKPPGGVQTQ